MLDGAGLIHVKKAFPDRVFDVGIAEPHAVTMAAGLAVGGMKPFGLDLLDVPPAGFRSGRS